MDYRDPDWIAEQLGIDKNTVYKYLHDGTIPAIQLGRKWLVSEARLIEWMQQETEKQTRGRREVAGAAEGPTRRLDNYTSGAKSAWKFAHGEALRLSHDHLDQLHLLLGILNQGKSVAEALGRFGVDAALVHAELHKTLKPAPGPIARRLPRNTEIKRAMRLAGKLARREAAGPMALIGVDHLLLGVLLARRGNGFELLVRQGVTRRELSAALGEIPNRREIPEKE